MATETKEADWVQIAFDYLKSYEHYDPQSDETYEDIKQHTTLCDDPEHCWICSMRDCPNHEPMHYHHDGCPSGCETEQQDDGEPQNTEQKEQTNIISRFPGNPITLFVD